MVKKESLDLFRSFVHPISSFLFTRYQRTAIEITCDLRGPHELAKDGEAMLQVPNMHGGVSHIHPNLTLMLKLKARMGTWGGLMGSKLRIAQSDGFLHDHWLALTSSEIYTSGLLQCRGRAYFNQSHR